jgi:hypothetical protein
MVEIANGSHEISTVNSEQSEEFDLGLESAQSRQINVENYQDYIIEAIKTRILAEQYEVIDFFLVNYRLVKC